MIDYSRKKLTSAILRDLNFDRAVYIESTPLGAMGNAGGVVLYFLEDGRMICFETNIEKDKTTYAAFHAKFNDNKDKFLPYYGGMGNYVFINKQSAVIANEEYEHLILVDGQKGYRIDSSSRGVFMSVAELL